MDFFEEALNLFSHVFDKMNESEEVTQSGNRYYKSEIYQDGELVSQVEKEWKDGKLVKDIQSGSTKSIENKNCTDYNMTDPTNKDEQCQCSTQCNCKTETDNTKCKCNESINEEVIKQMYEKIEGRFVNKLKLIEKEVDGLKTQLEESLALNDRLIKENESLKKDLESKNEKFETLRRFIG